MLRALRDGAKSGFLKYILLGMLVLAAGGLVLTDVGGFFRGGGVSNNTIAEGKNLEISTRAFDRVVGRVLSRQGMSPQEAYNMGIINQILNNEIQTLITTNEAREFGLNISDETVMTQISKIAEPLATDGMSKKEALQTFLANQRVSEGEFVQAIRQEMANNLFRGALISTGATISKAQAQDIYQFRNEERDVRGFTLTNDNAKIINEPSDENLQKYYDANKSDFAIAETRNITIATLKREMLKDKVDITEDDLRDFYDENIKNYEKPKRYKLQQAILDVQTEAQDIVKKATSGTSLKKAVEQVAGNASPYLGENLFAKNELMEEVSKDVTAAKSGDILGPIQSPLGWHIITMQDIVEPTTESFESVKTSIEKILLETTIEEDYIDLSNSIDDRLASGEKLNDIVTEVGLTTETLNNINQAGLNPKAEDLLESYQGDRAIILENAFDYDQGETSPVLEMTDGRYVFIRIDNIKERDFKKFSDLKDTLKTRWNVEQRSLANKQRTEEAFEAYKAGSSLEDIAKTYGATIKNYSKLSRSEAPKAPLTPLSMAKIYEAGVQSPLNLDIQNGYFIGEVTKISLPNIENASKEIEAIQAETKQILPQETIGQYINNISTKNNIKINERALKQLYGTQEQ